MDTEAATLLDEGLSLLLARGVLNWKMSPGDAVAWTSGIGSLGASAPTDSGKFSADNARGGGMGEGEGELPQYPFITCRESRAFGEDSFVTSRPNRRVGVFGIVPGAPFRP